MEPFGVKRDIDIPYATRTEVTTEQKNERFEWGLIAVIVGSVGLAFFAIGVFGIWARNSPDLPVNVPACIGAVVLGIVLLLAAGYCGLRRFRMRAAVASQDPLHANPWH
ncbi:MAG: hypothetical protein ACTHLZ_04680 [Tepidisphaeraceae bacterium]